MLSPPPFNAAASWSTRTWALLLAALSLATLLIHGYHPFAEDGGLYAAGVEYTLDPSLFPHFTAFVTAHLRFSLFAPTLALGVRVTHLSLASVLLSTDLLAAFVTLFGARELLRRCVPEDTAQLAGLALLAAGWTLPIAGTSLFLMDPYITARTLSMPLSLLAVAYALDPWRVSPGLLRNPALRCAACLALSAVFHPLMAAYAFLLVIAVRATSSKRPWLTWSAFASSLLLACLATNTLSSSDTAPERVAVITRYYWFLSQWHWYERLGLLGPLVMLGLVVRANALRAHAANRRNPLQTLGRAAILLGLLCTLCALFFAHESTASHMVARLQLLRIFLLLYAVMLLLLGATISRLCTRAASLARGFPKHFSVSDRACHLDRRPRSCGRSGETPVFRTSDNYTRRSTALSTTFRAVPALAAAAMAAGMFFAERATYPVSPHVELPWRSAITPNPWVQAFLWTRDNTPHDALFALDAEYVNTGGEDAQVFRAISLRSALPDYSKDGGEASITPTLAPTWLAAAEAQKGLSDLTDTERDRRLQPFAVTWMVLHAAAETTHPCPYVNRTVKVCHLQP